MKIELLEKDRVRYVSLILLNKMINFKEYFPVKLVGEQIFLTTYLEGLFSKGMLDIDNGYYVPTELGRKELSDLYAKYYEFIRMFDVFSAVDLEAGEFAFASMFEEFTEEEWFNYINHDRFSDLRVAVAQFKGINPIELVFLSFLDENRFDTRQLGWEKYLTDYGVWQEVLDICNSAVSYEYLMADGVLEEVIKQGSALAIDLVRQAEEIDAEIKASYLAEEESYEEVIEETTYVERVEMPVYEYDYWDSYYDPYYVSPIWIVPILLW